MARRTAIAASAAVPALLGCAGLLVVARPQYDPYGWLLWGREIVHGSGFSTAQYPSWKPLAALLAVPVSLAGAAAPTLWLIVERTLALAGIALAYLLARRLAGRTAGVIAALGVVLVSGWLGETLDGRLEPVVATLLLGACWADAEGKRGVALALLTAAALARPDAWIACGIYALAFVEKRRRLWPLLPTLCVALGLIWFGGDFLGSGSALRGGNLARESTPVAIARHADGATVFALRVAIVAPLGALAIAALGRFARGLQRRDRLVLMLGLTALSWVATDALLAARGYPPDQRYAVPQAALVSVLGAAGLVHGLRYTAQRAPRRWLQIPVAGATGIALVASTAPALTTSAASVRDAQAYSANVAALARLASDLQATGNHPAAIGEPFRTPYAWYADAAPGQISRPRVGGLAVVGRRSRWRRLHALAERITGTDRLPTKAIAVSGAWHAVLLLGPDGVAGRPVDVRAEQGRLDDHGPTARLLGDFRGRRDYSGSSVW